MQQNNDDQQFNAQYYNQEKFLDIVTKNKINNHISNIHSKITEEDINNVKTDIGITVALAKLLSAGINSLKQDVRKPIIQLETY